jgi:hypothetical protein
VTNASDQLQTFASRPLAEYQAESAAAGASRDATPPDAGAAAPRVPAAEVPVVDIHFDDLPDEDYAEFVFPLKTTPGIYYVLGIDDDAVLYEVMDVAQHGSPNDIIDYFFKSTFRRALDEQGNEVAHGMRILMNAINRGVQGARESRRYLMSVVTTAIENWSEEMTDTSMRPMNRAQRRARRR